MKKRTFLEYLGNPIRAKKKKYQEFFDKLWCYDNRIDGDESAEYYWRDFWEDILEKLSKSKK
jgi:hypothetical protein